MSQRRWWQVALAVVGVFIVIVAVARGQQVYLAPDIRWEPPPPQQVTPAVPTGMTQPQISPDDGDDLLQSMVNVALVIAGLVLLAVGIYFLVRFINWLRERNIELPKPKEPGVRRTEVADQLEEEGQAALLQLEDYSFEGIIAAWQAVQRAGAAVSEPREEWETSTEYATRLAAELRAAQTDVIDLAGLYRRARFSGHETSREDLDQARAALTAIITAVREAAERQAAADRKEAERLEQERLAALETASGGDR